MSVQLSYCNTPLYLLNKYFGYVILLCQKLVQVKMRKFLNFNLLKFSQLYELFHIFVQFCPMAYSYNDCELVSYCRKRADIQKSIGMPNCNLEF